MVHNRLWLIAIVIVAGSLLVACGQTTAVTAKKIPPAKVEPIEGTKLNRVTLLQDAAKRLDIQTAPLREEPVVRNRKYGGKVASVEAGKALVRVSLAESDMKKVRQTESALVLSLDAKSGTAAVPALPIRAPAGTNPEEAAQTLYYEVSGANHGLTTEQRVLVQVTLAGSGEVRKVIPYAAVLYDAHGDTWVYTNPQPLAYIRHAIKVDYVDAQLAVLLEGPAAGTAIVTVGGAELYGTEFGVGK